jgi:hypothetical protein
MPQFSTPATPFPKLGASTRGGTVTKKITMQEAADTYGVSTRTIRRTSPQVG